VLFARERGSELFRRKPLALFEGHLLTLPGSLREHPRIVFSRHCYKSELLQKGLVVNKKIWRVRSTPFRIVGSTDIKESALPLNGKNARSELRCIKDQSPRLEEVLEEAT
jgi:hypothetical protein